MPEIAVDWGDEMNDFTPEDVLEYLRLFRYPDKRATKRMIANYLELPYSNSHNNQVDRKIRDMVTELRKQGYPIISTSGKSGYWYDPDSVGIIIADMRSRIIDMSETVRALERGYMPERARQMELV